MLTQAENDTLTRVGPGTPAGELLRRYWHVAAAACELTEEAPVKSVRLLGEDLVLFRMPPAAGASEARYGLVEEHCPHRLASFKHGLVDCEGIRCIYHGWKFSADGTCLEQPPEGPASSFKDRVRHRAYPVEKLAGLLFAYLGPAPAPLLPRWDVLVREDGRRFGMHRVGDRLELGCKPWRTRSRSLAPVLAAREVSAAGSCRSVKKQLRRLGAAIRSMEKENGILRGPSTGS